jgi:hypothetical protein
MYAFWYTFVIKSELLVNSDAPLQTDEHGEKFHSDPNGRFRLYPVDLSDAPEDKDMSTHYLQSKMAFICQSVEKDGEIVQMSFLESQGFAYFHSMNGFDFLPDIISLSKSFAFGSDMVFIHAEEDVDSWGTFQLNPAPEPAENDDEGWENWRGFIPVDCSWIKLSPMDWRWCKIERKDIPLTK